MKQKYLILKETLEQTEQAERGPTKRLSKRKPTDNASWGGPQQREFRQEIPQAQGVGWLKRFY